MFYTLALNMFDTVPSSPYNMTPPPLRRPQHFIFFVREFDLIGQRELQPLNEAPYDLISTFFNERKAKKTQERKQRGEDGEGREEEEEEEEEGLHPLRWTWRGRSEEWYNTAHLKR